MPEPLELRLYRWALRFFPIEFQRQYGQEMIAAFHDALEDARQAGRLPAFWLESVKDTASSLWRERRQQAKKWEAKMFWHSKPRKNAINRYDSRSRLLFHFAREEQFKLRHSKFVNAEHLLIALTRIDGPASQVLRDVGCTPELLRKYLNDFHGLAKIPMRSTEAPVISPEARHTAELAAGLARDGDEGVIEPRHILLAILEQPNTVAYQALLRFATPEQLRASI